MHPTDPSQSATTPPVEFLGNLNFVEGEVNIPQIIGEYFDGQPSVDDVTLVPQGDKIAGWQPSGYEIRDEVQEFLGFTEDVPVQRVCEMNWGEGDIHGCILEPEHGGDCLCCCNSTFSRPNL